MAVSDTRFDVRSAGTALEDQRALSCAPRLAPEKQRWNVPAKVGKAQQIADEELLRSKKAAAPLRPHNDQYDALRHARWSQRMASEIDPVSAWLFGAGHEIESSLPSPARLERWGVADGLQQLAARRGWRDQPAAEALMDMRNNAEDQRAAAEGRGVNPSNLQTRLNAPPAANRSYARARPHGGGGGVR